MTLLAMQPWTLVAAVHPDETVVIAVAPMEVDLRQGPEAAPIRRHLAGKCFTVDILGTEKTEEFIGGVVEYLALRALDHCDETPHVCAVQTLYELWAA